MSQERSKIVAVDFSPPDHEARLEDFKRSLASFEDVLLIGVEHDGSLRFNASMSNAMLVFTIEALKVRLLANPSPD